MYAILAAAFPVWFSGSGDGDDAVPGRRSPTLPAESAPLPRDPLVTRLRAGDVTALEQVHRMYAAELWRHAHRYLRDRDAAEDVVQDVFVAVWERRAELAADTSLRPYLYSAVRNRALKQLRHGAVVERARDRAAAFDPPEGSGIAELADAGAEQAALAALVRRALDELPERQRAAIELRWLRHLNFTETAAVLGVSEAAVRKLVEKALAKLTTLHQYLREP